jgi:hypothetical protein
MKLSILGNLLGKLLYPKIYSLKITPCFNQGVIAHLYYKILIKDEYWHFFYEGSYGVIRTTLPRQTTHALKQRKDFGFTVENEGVWIDNIPITKKHQPIFRDIFHAYSVLSMEMGYKDFLSIYDRITHCFFNMAVKPKEFVQEEKALSQLLIDRAFTSGYLRGEYNASLRR